MLPDQIIQYVGQQGYGRTFISDTDPALDPANNVAPGDYWVKPSTTGTWENAKTRKWSDVKTGTWYDLISTMSEMFVRRGSGQSATWLPVNDKSAITEAYTRITQTQDAITQEAYRASEAEGELSSQIVQTAEGIRQSVAQSYIAKTGNYSTVDQIISEAESLASAAATSAKDASIAKTSVYQTAEAIVSTAVAQAATAASNTYIAKTTNYQTADAIVTEASRLATNAETNAKNASIAKTTSYQTADAIINEASRLSGVAETNAKNASIARTTTYQTADSIKTEAVKTSAQSIAPAFSTTKAYAINDIVSYNGKVYKFKSAHPAGAWNSGHVDEVQTTSVFSTIEQTASSISAYVSDNAYGKVSGIAINSNGVTITGSKYIKLDSGYVEAAGWKFSAGGLSYYVSDSQGTTIAQFRVITTAESIYDIGELLINSDKMILINPTAAYSCCMTFYTYLDGSNIPHVVMGHRAITGVADLGISSDWFYQAYIRNVHYNSLVQESSRDVKHNIVDIQPSGSRIDQLKPVTFVYNDDDNEMMHSGLIYEDTISVFPEICMEDNGIKSIRYIELVPYLLKEIQELRKRVKQLEH